MNRPELGIALCTLGCWASASFAAEKGDSSPKAAAGARIDGALYSPGKAIPVAKSRPRTQIGRATDYRSFRPIIMGTADVFGKGPYDLFLHPNRLFPFVAFDDDGTPMYGEPITTQGESINGAVITGPGGAIYGVFADGKKLKVCRFDRKKTAFETFATSPAMELPTDIGIGIAADVEKSNKLHVYFSVADGLPYRPPPPPEYRPKAHFPHYHDETYMPFDGAGIWRGNIHRRILYHAVFDSLNVGKTLLVERSFPGPGEFLFDAWGMTIVHLGKDRPTAVISAEHLGMLREFAIDPANGKLSPGIFVNNEEEVGLRHPVINASVKAIADPKTGSSNLIVGDSGRVWFYPFSGKFSANGSPIYREARPVMAEGVPLSFGELPIISPGDVDGDGLIDFIVGNDAGQLLFVKNIGTRGRPEFDNAVAVPVGGKPLDVKAGYRGSIQGPAEAMWGYTCPTLYDWNGDGRLDVIQNSVLADYIVLLQQPAERGIPAFAEPKLLYCDGLQLHLVWRSQPAVTDWGKPGGRLCMIALDEQNLLRAFWRIDNENVERGELLKLQDGSSITANVDEAAGQVGRAKLVAHDWDGDGAVDLLIGTSRGLSFPASKSVYYPSHFYPEHKAAVLLLRNVGTNDKPVFDYVRLIEFQGERIGLGIHCCSPAPVDFGRGKVDLFVGEENGTIHYYPREALSVSGPAR